MPRAATLTQAKATRIFAAIKAAGFDVAAVEIEASTVRVIVGKRQGDAQALPDMPKSWDVTTSPFPDSLP